jgi:hypothetical protein
MFPGFDRDGFFSVSLNGRFPDKHEVLLRTRGRNGRTGLADVSLVQVCAHRAGSGTLSVRPPDPVPGGTRWEPREECPLSTIPALSSALPSESAGHRELTRRSERPRARQGTLSPAADADCSDSFKAEARAVCGRAVMLLVGSYACAGLVPVCGGSEIRTSAVRTLASCKQGSTGLEAGFDRVTPASATPRWESRRTYGGRGRGPS